MGNKKTKTKAPKKKTTALGRKKASERIESIRVNLTTQAYEIIKDMNYKEYREFVSRAIRKATARG